MVKHVSQTRIYALKWRCPYRSNSLGFTLACTLGFLADLTAARFLSDVDEELSKSSAKVADLVARVNDLPNIEPWNMKPTVPQQWCLWC